MLYFTKMSLCQTLDLFVEMTDTYSQPQCRNTNSSERKFFSNKQKTSEVEDTERHRPPDVNRDGVQYKAAVETTGVEKRVMSM